MTPTLEQLQDAARRGLFKRLADALGCETKDLIRDEPTQ